MGVTLIFFALSLVPVAQAAKKAAGPKITNPQAQCFETFSKRPGMSHESDVRDICELSTEGARECVYRNFVGQKKFRFMNDAKEICQYRSESTRSCLLAYANEEAPFNIPSDEIDAIAPILKRAVPLCEIDDQADRACVLRLLRKRVYWNVPAAYRECLSQGKEYDACLQVVARRLGPAYGRRICIVPNFEVRSCLLEKYLADRDEPFYPGYRTQCEAEFLQNLLKPLEGSAHGAGCDFLP